MIMRKMLVAAAAMSVACAAGAANASVVFSENFNNAAFQGALLPLGADHTSDRWASAFYYGVNDADGWSFSGTSFSVRDGADASDGAVLLNEPTGKASHLLSGLNVGQIYNVSFLLWGDNRPAQGYVLGADVDGGSAYSVAGVDGLPGSNPGTTYSFNFTAASISQTLNFYHIVVPGSEASPIIDNIVVSTVDATPVIGVPEPASWALMLLGFGGLGAMLRRRRAALA